MVNFGTTMKSWRDLYNKTMNKTVVSIEHYAETTTFHGWEHHFFPRIAGHEGGMAHFQPTKSKPSQTWWSTGYVNPAESHTARMSGWPIDSSNPLLKSRLSMPHSASFQPAEISRCKNLLAQPAKTGFLPSGNHGNGKSHIHGGL